MATQRKTKTKAAGKSAAGKSGKGPPTLDHPADAAATAATGRGRAPRPIWKGAIAFGLVHIPVTLYPASTETGIDFDWLDRRSMDPVGYKRVNKRTGREVDRADIVKGVKVESGEYVVLGEEEIRAAFPKATQTIEIESFVRAEEIAFTLLEKPYFLEPSGKSDKVYALLREAMHAAGVVGIARVVMHTKEYLAALIPSGPALILNTLRWANEVRQLGQIELPPEGAGALREGELKMAKQLIADMTLPWHPEHYADRFTEAVHELIAKRVAGGHTEAVEPMEKAREASNVVDLTALLKQSLQRKEPAAHRKSPAKVKKRA
jgi:DNA end-binding protein Ku